MLPPFNEFGLLQPSDYSLTLEQLKASSLVLPTDNACNWDQLWRLHLVTNLELMVGQLRHVGIENIFVDGSFVENKGIIRLVR